MTSTSTSGHRTRTLLLTLVVALGHAGAVADRAAASTHVAGPGLLAGATTELLVKVRGGTVCSGTPLADLPYVVTAAHCVLERDGSVATRRTVERDGARYAVRAIIVDERYADDPSPAIDAAVLVLDAPLPGPGARLATALPEAGSLTLAGFQPLDSDGSLLRGTNPDDRPRPAGAGSVIQVRSEVAGCHVAASALTVRLDRIDVPCGLIPGASGGALLVRTATGVELAGIVSTVTWDLDTNGVTPVSALLALLADAERMTTPSASSAAPARAAGRS